MKEIFAIIFLFFFVAFSIKAQGNLQFHRAVFETYPFVLSQPRDTVLFSLIVPSGKVLKIESFGVGQKNWVGGYSLIGMTLDSDVLIVRPPASSADPDLQSNSHTIWLESGNHTLSFIADDSGSGVQFSGFISGIEFNLIP